MNDEFLKEIDNKVSKMLEGLSRESHVLVIFRGIPCRDNHYSLQLANIPPKNEFYLVSEIAYEVPGFNAEDINIFLCAHGYLERDRNTGKSNTVYNYYPTEKARRWWLRINNSTIAWEKQFVFKLLEKWSKNGKACFRTPTECANIFGYSEEQFNAVMEIRGYQTVSNGKCYPSKKLKEGEADDCHYTEYEEGRPLWNVFQIKSATHRNQI